VLCTPFMFAVFRKPKPKSFTPKSDIGLFYAESGFFDGKNLDLKISKNLDKKNLDPGLYVVFLGFMFLYQFVFLGGSLRFIFPPPSPHPS